MLDTLLTIIVEGIGTGSSHKWNRKGVEIGEGKQYINPPFPTPDFFLFPNTSAFCSVQSKITLLTYYGCVIVVCVILKNRTFGVHVSCAGGVE
jgi:hypothetical protein